MFAFRGRSVVSAAIVLSLGAGYGVARGDDAPTEQQLLQKIDSLEAKVQSLEAQQNANDSATLNAIQADANSHSQLLSTSGVGLAGYDPETGFQITSDDGNFLLYPWLLGQFRGAFNDRQSTLVFNNGDTGGGIADPQFGSGEHDGFEVHNLMLGVNGHVVTPELQYFVDLNVQTDGGGVTLQDAYAIYSGQPNCNFGLKAGQFVDPVWHESNVDDGHLATVDRSLVGVLLGGNTGLNNTAERTQGVGVVYDGKCLHGEVDLTDGRDTANTPFYDVSVNGLLPPQNFGMAARVEYKVMGDDSAWQAYNSMSALGTKTDLLVAGGGFEWDEASNFDNLYFTIDGQFITQSGLSVYGAVLENYADWSDNGTAQDTQERDLSGSYPNFGVLLQVAWRVTPKWEPFVRYDLSVLNSRYADILAFGTKDPGGNVHATDNNHEFTAGVNYYLYDYRAKVSGDVSFLPNGSAVDATGLDILANQEHSEWIGRIQFQLAI